MSLRALIEAITTASQDARVRGLVILFPAEGAGAGGSMDLSMVQELRDSIEKFRRCGKVTVSWAASFGDGAAGNLEYLLASACQFVFLQPSGTVGLMGLQAQVPFLKDVLSRWNVMAQFSGREKYKSAMNTFTESGFTPPQRENLGPKKKSSQKSMSWYIRAVKSLL